MGISDITGKVKTARPAIPQIYAYTTPEIKRHNGWTKIGYTEQDVETRVKQQTHTADVYYVIEWHSNAMYEDGSGTFKDTDFHGYLRKLDVKNEAGTEWFEIEPVPAKTRLYEFRENHGIIEDTPDSIPYQLRQEQAEAVSETLDYARLHERGEFLWNAKPRFGKTLTSYDLCVQLGAQKVLIVTNRPAIANSWYEDYVKFLGSKSGYCFISEIDALRGKPYVMTREEYLGRENRAATRNFIEFVSLQNLKGAIDFGGKYDKLRHVADLEWDVLIIDEAHEGVDTFKTDVAFDHIKRKFTLHLSGTPFKAIANEKFAQNAIFNWTYADEQKAKREWGDQENPNPYGELPQLNMFTYKMSDIVLDKAQRGADLAGDTVEYAFDLNEFFATDARGYFQHSDDVDRFLDALTQQKKFPFSTPELRDELRHTFWMLNRVDSARALAKKLKNHPVFKDYEVVLAAGDGRIDDEDESLKAYDKVKAAITEHDKTITLSVGQLTTGVTIPEWTAVLMLSNMKSPSLYMQAAFRAQNPCLFDRGGKFLRKENAYVFDFDPARTLIIFEEFANDLYSDTASGGGDTDTRKNRIRTLLNFFPVLGEDEGGQMIELNAERVMSIPRRIRSQEVVRRGFMSDFLFQNISNIFRAPAEVIEIVQALEPYKAPNEVLGIKRDTADGLNLNDKGEIEIPEEQIIGTATDLFGSKVYGNVADELDSIIDSIAFGESEPSEEDKALERLCESFVASLSNPLVQTAKENYGSDMKPAQQKKVERKIKADTEIKLNREFGSFKIERNRIEKEREQELAHAQSATEEDDINSRHDARIAEAKNELVEHLKSSREVLVKSAGETVVREVETAKKEATKQTIEGGVRDHLRGFSRTIPSFLMAYGDAGTTLEKLDEVIPEDVFLEVTSITADQFRFLRDGGDFTNRETGEVEHFDGGLFDPVVFNDSVKEFIRLRGELANYFDETVEEDIFDYVPPQKTNQIYTPRRVVADMVDMFEKENPGCFDNPDHTFADLYMKSGLYITEIVKRLYRNEEMRQLYPDDGERLKHILENQVFGIAPTKIIYQIATHYILGYDNEIGEGLDTNFVCADSAEMAKDGTLSDFVEKTFGGKLGGSETTHGSPKKSAPPRPASTSSHMSTEPTAIAPIDPSVKRSGRDDGDWIIEAVESEGIEFVDKRSSGGNLWVIGGKSIQGLMRLLEKHGAKFTYKENGGKATEHQPAWYIPASVAERALRKH